VLAGAGVLCLLATMTYRQTQIWKTTETLLRQILKVEPSSGLAHYHFGVFLAEQGKHAEAISHYRQALSVRPTGSMNWFLVLALWSHRELARSLTAMGNVEEAQQHYQEWLQLRRSGKSAEAAEAMYHAELAKILSRQGEAKEAEAHFKKAIELDPNLPFCVLNNCM
jgi:protein O-GlcNAc transferase